MSTASWPSSPLTAAPARRAAPSRRCERDTSSFSTPPSPFEPGVLPERILRRETDSVSRRGHAPAAGAGRHLVLNLSIDELHHNLTHLNWDGAATLSRHLARTVLPGLLAVDPSVAPVVLRAPVEAGCDEHATGDRTVRLINPKRSLELLAARR
jgi:hypothetical protein